MLREPRKAPCHFYLRIFLTDVCHLLQHGYLVAHIRHHCTDMQLSSSPERASVASGRHLASSLENILQAEASFSLNPRASWTSNRANVPLPAFRSSSIAAFSEPSVYAKEFSTYPSRSFDRPESWLSNGLSAEKTCPRVRIDDSRMTTYFLSMKPTFPSTRTKGLNYTTWGIDRSYTFSHRYGSSTRRGLLLNPLLRSNVLPVDLSARKFGTAFPGSVTRSKDTRSSNIPAPSFYGSKKETGEHLTTYRSSLRVLFAFDKQLSSKLGLGSLTGNFKQQEDYDLRDGHDPFCDDIALKDA